MKKQLLAALIGTAGLFVASQAFAQHACGSCTIGMNGTQLNGLPTPGPVFQGTQINGLPTPGPIFQGTQINGMPTPGPIFQGTQLNGMPAPGPIVQLIQSQVAERAPNWSGLPVSRMTVRLAPAI